MNEKILKSEERRLLLYLFLLIISIFFLINFIYASSNLNIKKQWSHWVDGNWYFDNKNLGFFFLKNIFWR